MNILAIYFFVGLVTGAFASSGETTSQGVFWLVVWHVVLLALHTLGCWHAGKHGEVLGFHKWFWWLAPPAFYAVGFVGMCWV
jgi:hypothetical protein